MLEEKDFTQLTNNTMRKQFIEVGQQFKIKESGKVVISTKQGKLKDKDKFLIEYYDKEKESFWLSEAEINRNLNFGSWIKTKI